MNQTRDSGLQPERTALAWRRTGLSLTVGALVSFRVLPHYWGSWGISLAGAGVALSLAILVLSHRRYRVHHLRFTPDLDRRPDLPGGGLLALLAATGLAAAISALLLVLTM